MVEIQEQVEEEVEEVEIVIKKTPVARFHCCKCGVL